MRRTILALAVLLLGTTAAHATEPVEADFSESVVPQLVESSSPITAELNLSKVEVEQRSATDETAAAQFAPRGSFWWMVGVIVVAAGIVLLLT